jgi:hypothetical protein
VPAIRRITALLLLIIFLVPLHAVGAESIFPDVPMDHLYRKYIEELVGAQVINGNDDGTFAPERDVNRAEMLAMLYRALGRSPDPAHTGCFKDVLKASWYEAIVCDAAANRFVQGYQDGTFRPGTAVNRVEALKMITEIFAIKPGRYGVEERDIIKFVDVSTSAWYSGYLYTAFVKGILPIPGQDAARFYPEWPLKRGEAAAYIYNAVHVGLDQAREEAKNSTSAASQRPSSVNTASSKAAPVSQAVTFPFSVGGKFSGTQPFSYTFTLVNALTARTEVKLTTVGMVSCRLYLIGENSFSEEYFLGYQEGAGCTLLTALRPGKYQLQVQPTVDSASYTVEMKAATGDGNAGFTQAKRLLPGVATTRMLPDNNIVDFYTFSVASEVSMKVELSNAMQLSCIIYAMKDVNLADFAGPQCNQNYLYPKGTYFVAVGRGTTKGARQTYTVFLR